jgi:uncharacterized protein (DUF305 family)
MNRTTTGRRALLAGAAVLATLLLTAACAGEHTGGMNHGSPAPPTASVPAGGTFNETDVQFVQNMIPHHEQAGEMAQLAETRASDPEIKELAAPAHRR